MSQRINLRRQLRRLKLLIRIGTSRQCRALTVIWAGLVSRYTVACMRVSDWVTGELDQIGAGAASPSVDEATVEGCPGGSPQLRDERVEVVVASNQLTRHAHRIIRESRQTRSRRDRGDIAAPGHDAP